MKNNHNGECVNACSPTNLTTTGEKMDADTFISIYASMFINQNKAHLKNGNQTIKREVLDMDIRHHLNGESRLGIFPIVQNTSTKFFVFDIDNQCKDTCKKIINQLEKDGFNSYLERSKSKGFHVWVFLEFEQKAKDVRNYMKNVLEQNKIPRNKIDLFPKQDETTDLAPYGNGINLPMFGVLSNLQTSATLFLNEDFILIEDQLTYLLNFKKIDFKVNTNIIDTNTETIHQLTQQSYIDQSHECEKLEKLIKVGRKTRSTRENVIKAKKETRSERDTVYAKHLAELMFSPELIEKELCSISNKLNDPGLRGQPKLNYLEDKKRQFSYLRDLLANNAVNDLQDSKTNTPPV